MADNFSGGEAESYNTAGPSITDETMGPAFKIATTIPGSRGAHVQQRSNYIMQGPARGTNETVIPGIQLTDLGAENPHPAMPAPIVAGHVGAFPCNEDNGQFKSGIIDGWPEGPPVPVR
jgi:hypothetical protein